MKKNSFTILIIPHNSKGRMKYVKIPSSTLIVVTLFFLVLFSSFAMNVIFTGRILSYEVALFAKEAKEKRIDKFDEESNKLKAAVLEMHLRNNQLRELLGVAPEKPGAKMKNLFGEKLLARLESGNKDFLEALNDVAGIANSDKEELIKLKNRVSETYKKISAVPSRWPIYGRIESGFGYRVDPWAGFHKGVDIKGQFGYPFRSTAPGRVVFSGWRQGYGKTIIIEHQLGFSTLFAHCSETLVAVGEEIKAGQVIGKIGMTGFTTGSHLHYEVSRNGQQVNPLTFLDLKVLAAVRILK